jgi:MFS family permease
LGGVFTDHLTWRWCFYINLPFGAVTALFIIFFFKAPGKHVKKKLTFSQQLRALDLEGNMCFIPGVVCLLLALQWGGAKYPWGSGRIIALFVLFGVFIITFITFQALKKDRAMVPPRVFLNRTVWSCSFFAACLGASFFVLIFYVRSCSLLLVRPGLTSLYHSCRFGSKLSRERQRWSRALGISP